MKSLTSRIGLVEIYVSAVLTRKRVYVQVQCLVVRISFPVWASSSIHTAMKMVNMR